MYCYRRQSKKNCPHERQRHSYNGMLYQTSIYNCIVLHAVYFILCFVIKTLNCGRCEGLYYKYIITPVIRTRILEYVLLICPSQILYSSIRHYDLVRFEKLPHLSVLCEEPVCNMSSKSWKIFFFCVSQVDVTGGILQTDLRIDYLRKK